MNQLYCGNLLYLYDYYLISHCIFDLNYFNHWSIVWYILEEHSIAFGLTSRTCGCCSPAAVQRSSDSAEPLWRVFPAWSHTQWEERCYERRDRQWQVSMTNPIMHWVYRYKKAWPIYRKRRGFRLFGFVLLVIKKGVWLLHLPVLVTGVWPLSYVSLSVL